MHKRNHQLMLHQVILIIVNDFELKIFFLEVERVKLLVVKQKHNLENNIVPKGIERGVSDVLEGLHVVRGSKKRKESARRDGKVARDTFVNTEQLGKDIVSLEKQMFQYAKDLKFEDAAKTRDKIEELRSVLVKL